MRMPAVSSAETVPPSGSAANCGEGPRGVRERGINAAGGLFIEPLRVGGAFPRSDRRYGTYQRFGQEKRRELFSAQGTYHESGQHRLRTRFTLCWAGSVCVRT